MEKWDIYDKDGNLSGKTKTRNDVFEPGEFHLGVSIWIMNQKGELLIQKRAALKRIHPNIWSTTGGSVISGETSVEGCIRETKEEIGLQIHEENLVLLSRSFKKDTIFDDYITICDIPTESIVIQPDEVSEVKWASTDEIIQLFSLGLFMLDDLNDMEKVFQYINRHFRE